jgi:hypothetical protein
MIDSRHLAAEWQSRQMVVTPEQLGMRSVGDCRTRAEQLGLTALPALPYKQEFWRLDTLLLWSRGNGFEYLPMLGIGIAPRLK